MEVKARNKINFIIKKVEAKKQLGGPDLTHLENVHKCPQNIW